MENPFPSKIKKRGSKMQNDFFSQVHNFQSAATGSVDPRTGLFTYTLHIAQLTGNHHLGPAQTIALAEQVNYHARGHRFPDGAPLSYLPYVTRYTQFPGHGPEIVRTYEYTVANFLGHGVQGRWHPDEDYLYGALSDYQYGSTEHWNNGTTQRHITRRYNQYHLLVSETTEQNGCKRVHQTDYYARTGNPFKAQPPQFQMPKRATVSFNDAAGSEVMQTEFDEAGNPTVQITPDGTRTDWVYYPAGEAAGKDKKGKQDKKGGGCPTSPQGFVRFVKSKTVTPGKASPAGRHEDAPVHQTVYRYATLPTRPGAPCDDAVVCIYQGEYSAGRLLHESRISYVNDVTSQDHGRI
ncbi:hypothetical protein ID858_12820 [Xenorhabdus sp. DI]|uniref:hypothetical protein n=1 Tax=Xenorhabdus doucetiae TaxID=351671 RepID=UPI0019C30076|nr:MULTISPECIES: hypothetical protein [unclassified Xenorhabdus]MBD2784216.1 hypothetical protein [Xenorhabdus sp. 3]MBD2789391.1 hypothetical protein [Xenorhabdus sp. DI]